MISEDIKRLEMRVQDLSHDIAVVRKRVTELEERHKASLSRWNAGAKTHRKTPLIAWQR